MKQSNTSIYAYLAGIIDGDGSIFVSKRCPRNGRSMVYNVTVTVMQKDGRIPDWLYGNFGGTVYKKIYNRTEVNGHEYFDQYIYQWIITDKKAIEVLKRIIPFLIYKKEQAMLVLRLGERTGKTLKDDKNRFLKLSEHELGIREELRNKVQKLKKVFHPSKVYTKTHIYKVAAVETKCEESSVRKVSDSPNLQE